jgi:hypothetical protein
VHHVLIDFQAAYCTVWRKEIWSAMQKYGVQCKIWSAMQKYGVQCKNMDCNAKIWTAMQKLGFPKKLIKLLRIINNEMYGKVKIDKHLSSEFKFNKGWRHGDAIARVGDMEMQLFLCRLK